MVELRDVENIGDGARNISLHLKVVKNLTKIRSGEKLAEQGKAPSLVESNADLELEHIHKHSRRKPRAELSFKKTLEGEATLFVSDDPVTVTGQEVVGRPEPCG